MPHPLFFEEKQIRIFRFNKRIIIKEVYKLKYSNNFNIYIYILSFILVIVIIFGVKTILEATQKIMKNLQSLMLLCISLIKKNSGDTLTSNIILLKKKTQ